MVEAAIQLRRRTAGWLRQRIEAVATRFRRQEDRGRGGGAWMAHVDGSGQLKHRRLVSGRRHRSGKRTGGLFAKRIPTRGGLFAKLRVSARWERWPPS
uniref:Uncharacterized protein n=1 Tax=Oryza glumipatula TaxID=40148 RepID=A0A0E0BBN1_9ORYZ